MRSTVDDRPEPLLAARGLAKVYGTGPALVRAVDGVDLDVGSGETVSVMGPSGCGKSTLLYLLGGLERASAGEVRLAGERIDRLSETKLARLRRHAIGFVFQAFNLVDELTAVENVELPALLSGATPGAARQRAMQLLEQVGLTERARHLPAQLSGGQKQRAAIARALANHALVVLADEPTGNLDSAAATDVLRLFAQLRAAGQTLVVVTHDSRVAATADRLLTMRDGAIVDQTRLGGETPGLDGLSVAWRSGHDRVWILRAQGDPAATAADRPDPARRAVGRAGSSSPPRHRAAAARRAAHRHDHHDTCPGGARLRGEAMGSDVHRHPRPARRGHHDPEPASYPLPCSSWPRSPPSRADSPAESRPSTP